MQLVLPYEHTPDIKCYRLLRIFVSIPDGMESHIFSPLCLPETAEDLPCMSL